MSHHDNQGKFELVSDEFRKCLAEGMSNRNMAAKFGVARRTIEKWRQRIRNGTDAVARSYYPEETDDIFERDNSNLLITKDQGRFDEARHKKLNGHNRFVITSIQNDTKINQDFFDALKMYCSIVGAKLLVVPVKYMFTKGSKFNVDPSDLFFEDVNLGKNIKLYSRLSIRPTIVDPFAGLDPLSKGDTIIIPHPQVSMKTMATLGDSPAQMHTTGSISIAKNAYQNDKTGKKAEFNHSNSALVVEIGDGNSFFVRTLNCDDNGGFYDCPFGKEGYYSKEGFKKLDEQIAGIYLGDSHLSVSDDKVVSATFTDKDSIMNVLKPLKTVHGDIFDCQSVSHHDEHDYLTRYGKHAFGLNDLEGEFNKTFELYEKIMPSFTIGVIDASNHNDHVYKYLTTADPKRDLPNAKIYHKLNWLMLENVKQTPSGPSYPNLLELWLNNSKFHKLTKNMEFLGRRKSYQIHGIEVSMHGDKGPNGSRGSPMAFSRLPQKCIVGHSHTPSIRLGCYTVGTTSRLDLSYTGGPSSWMHTHCIIYSNGKRQMISIINGKWRLMK